jgi:nicotinamidase-related amidase
MNHYVQFSALPRLLFARGITKVTICGLATDYCMRATVRRAPCMAATRELSSRRL